MSIQNNSYIRDKERKAKQDKGKEEKVGTRICRGNSASRRIKNFCRSLPCYSIIYLVYTIYPDDQSWSMTSCHHITQQSSGRSLELAPPTTPAQRTAKCKLQLNIHLENQCTSKLLQRRTPLSSTLFRNKRFALNIIMLQRNRYGEKIMKGKMKKLFL